MIAKLVVRTILWVGCLAALLFVTAGTLAWPGAWVLLGEMLASAIGFGLSLARHDPALFDERMKSIIQPGQKRWDKILLMTTFPLLVAWLVVMALDAGRYHPSGMPVALQAVGALCLALANVIGFVVMRQNSFAIPVVKLQHERRQRPVETGLYAYVRHPMYGGALLFFIGVPLLLGSWQGLGFMPVLAAIFAVRAVLEERMLARELEGYAEYAARVRYRLVPGIW